MRAHKPYVYLVAILSLFSCQCLHAQIETDLIEKLAEAQWNEEKTGYDDWIEDLQFLAQHKKNINELDETELQEVGFLDPLQVQNILVYRLELGKFLDIHELQAVPGIDKNLAALLSELYYVDPVGDAKTALKSMKWTDSKQQVLVRWQRVLNKQKGYTSSDSLASAYQGSQDALLLKYKFALGKMLQVGFTAEKDPGESYWNKSAGGLDHFGAYLTYKPNNTYLKSVYIGDFKANFGQGLISQGAYLGGKSSMVLQIAKSNFGFSKYASVSENSFRRGIAMELNYKDFDLYPYFSATKVDASLEEPVDTLETYSYKIKSLVQTGYHRTDSELEKRKNVWQFSTGISLRYNHRSQNYGVNGQLDHFQYPFAPEKDQYLKFRPLGPIFWLISLDHQNRIHHILLSGETAFSYPHGWAFVESLQSSIHKSLDLGILVRYYSPGYFSLTSNAFAAGNQSNNERGIYLSAVLNPFKGWKASFYVDIWQHPWLKYLTHAPTQGYEYFAKLEYTQKRKWSAYLIYQKRSKPKNGGIGAGGIAQIQANNLEKVTLHFVYRIHRTLELRNRFEMRRSDLSLQAAFLMYQDFIYKPLKSKFSFTARLAIFESSDYSTRLYAYENDLLYASSLPAYDKNGTRFYINTRYKINKNWTAECRWAIEYYPFEKNLSSGNDEIQSNRKNSIKIQLRFSI